MMQKMGINLQVHYIPVYHQKFMKQYGFSKKLFPVTEQYYSQEVSLPIYFSLNKKN